MNVAIIVIGMALFAFVSWKVYMCYKRRNYKEHIGEQSSGKMVQDKVKIKPNVDANNTELALNPLGQMVEFTNENEPYNRTFDNTVMNTIQNEASPDRNESMANVLMTTEGNDIKK